MGKKKLEGNWKNEKKESSYVHWEMLTNFKWIAAIKKAWTIILKLTR